MYFELNHRQRRRQRGPQNRRGPTKPKDLYPPGRHTQPRGPQIQRTSWTLEVCSCANAESPFGMAEAWPDAATNPPNNAAASANVLMYFMLRISW